MCTVLFCVKINKKKTKSNKIKLNKRFTSYTQSRTFYLLLIFDVVDVELVYV